MKRNGFTWLELMIVMAIITILASILVPAYFDYSKHKAVAMEFFDGKEIQLESWMFSSSTIALSFAKEWCFNNGVAANQLDAKAKELSDKFCYVVKNAKVSLESYPAETASDTANQGEKK